MLREAVLAKSQVREASLTLVGMGWFLDQPGGLNRYVHGLTQQLAEAGDRTHLSCVSNQPAFDQNQLQFSPLTSLQASLPQRLWQFRQNFHLDPNTAAINLHFALYSLPILHRLPQNLPITFTFHGPWASEGQEEHQRSANVRLKKWIEQRVYNRCDRFITLSQAFADILHRDYSIPYNKIHIIPGGINTQDFRFDLTRQQARDRLNFPQDRPILFTPRRLVHRMGIDKLLQALVTVQQQVPNVWLAVAGKGPQRQALEQQSQALGLADNVKFLGYVPDEDLPICYQAANLTVVPSQALEGFGLILLESLASGTPVLSTPVGGMPEVLRPFDENLVTADIGVEAIGDRLLQFLTGELTLPNREACRTYAVENYDWKIIAPRVKDVLLMPK